MSSSLTSLLLELRQEESCRLIISAAAGADETAAEEDIEDDVNDYKACASFLTMEFENDPVLATQTLQVHLSLPGACPFPLL